MNTLIKQIEKGKPFFDKIARNMYIGAIRDGFLTAMPVILFSSIFILLAAVPELTVHTTISCRTMMSSCWLRK